MAGVTDGAVAGDMTKERGNEEEMRHLLPLALQLPSSTGAKPKQKPVTRDPGDADPLRDTFLSHTLASGMLTELRGTQSRRQ